MQVGVKLEVADALCVAGTLEAVSEMESGPSVNPENGASLLLAASMNGTKRAREENSEEEDSNPAKRLAAAAGV